jgi:hypothetical protein
MFVWHALTNGKGVVDRPPPSRGLRGVPPKIATSGLANASLATACSIAPQVAHIPDGSRPTATKDGVISPSTVI